MSDYEQDLNEYVSFCGMCREWSSEPCQLADHASTYASKERPDVAILNALGGIVVLLAEIRDRR